jgi:L-ascorbate metabolism protein UlaG (beta-lactamase superfamily)
LAVAATGLQHEDSLNRLSISWLGHSTFILRTPGGKRLLFDPWLASNPACPPSFKKPPKVDLILVSHGHFDHIDDLVLCARESQAMVVAAFELCDWLARTAATSTMAR